MATETEVFRAAVLKANEELKTLLVEARDMVKEIKAILQEAKSHDNDD